MVVKRILGSLQSQCNNELATSVDAFIGTAQEHDHQGVEKHLSS